MRRKQGRKKKKLYPYQRRFQFLTSFPCLVSQPHLRMGSWGQMAALLVGEVEDWEVVEGEEEEEVEEGRPAADDPGPIEPEVGEGRSSEGMEEVRTPGRAPLAADSRSLRKTSARRMAARAGDEMPSPGSVMSLCGKEDIYDGDREEEGFRRKKKMGEEDMMEEKKR